PKINRAMRANVLIARGSGWFGRGHSAIGSGVIMKLTGAEALIITNRHVVDGAFESEAGRPAPADMDKIALDIEMVDQSIRPGKVVWIAPDGIDLALVQVISPSAQARESKWTMRRQAAVGEPVFAIGNPH